MANGNQLRGDLGLESLASTGGLRQELGLTPPQPQQSITQPRGQPQPAKEPVAAPSPTAPTTRARPRGATTTGNVLRTEPVGADVVVSRGQETLDNVLESLGIPAKTAREAQRASLQKQTNIPAFDLDKVPPLEMIAGLEDSRLNSLAAVLGIDPFFPRVPTVGLEGITSQKAAVAAEIHNTLLGAAQEVFRPLERRGPLAALGRIFGRAGKATAEVFGQPSTVQQLAKTTAVSGLVVPPKGADIVSSLPTAVNQTLFNVGDIALRLIEGGTEAVKGAVEQILIEAGVEKTKAKGIVEHTAIATAVATGGAAVTGVPGLAARRHQQYRRALDATAAQTAKATTPAGASKTALQVNAANTAVTLDRAADLAEREMALRVFDPEANLIQPGTTDLFVRDLGLDVQKQMVNAFVKEMESRGGLKPGDVGAKTVQENVVSVLKSTDPKADLTTEGLAKLTDNPAFNEVLEAANRAGVPVDVLFNEFLAAGTKAGQTLQMRSAVWRSLRQRALGGDEAAKQAIVTTYQARRKRAIANVGKPGSTIDKVLNLWRSLLLLTPRTIIRNVIDSNLRIGLDSLTRTLATGMQHVLFPEARGGLPAAPLSEMSRYVDGFTELDRRIRGRTGNRLTGFDIVERVSAAFPELTTRIFQTTLGPDVGTLGGTGVLDKLTRIAGYGNMASENFIRTAAFASHLDRQLAKRGLSIEDVFDNRNIPGDFEDMIRAAGDHALDMTFGKRPTRETPHGLLIKSYADFIQATKVGVIADPFARFLFPLTDYVFQYMPTGGMRLVSKANRAKIAAGDLTPVAREVVGSGLMIFAMMIRDGRIPGLQPGERFDEVAINGTTVSLLPFATIAPHLAIADLLTRARDGRLQADDATVGEFAKVALQYDPRAGVYTDAVDGAMQDLLGVAAGKDKTAAFNNLMAKVAAGALTPWKAINDFRSEFDDSLLVQRETKTRELGPLWAQIAPQLLPERESPLRAATPRAGKVEFLGRVFTGPLVEQLTGVKVKEPKTTAEKVFDHLGFRPVDIAPNTGDRQVDAVVNHFMGPYMEVVTNMLVQAPGWQRLPAEGQVAVFKAVINEAKRAALVDAGRVAPASKALANALRSTPQIDLNAIDTLLRHRYGEGQNLNTIINTVRQTVVQDEMKALGQ